MAKYVKLGIKAECFYDAIANLKALKNEVYKLTPKQEVSPKIRRAIQTGHLVLSTEKEFNAASAPAAEKAKPTKYDDMTKSELVEYLKENFQVDETEVEEFEKKKKKEMILELVDLEEE